MAKKTFIIISIVFLISLNSCAFDKWTREDKILQGIQLGVQGIDWLQTKEIARNDDFYETNPQIGKYPTQWEVDRYFIISAGVGVLATHVLPQEWRKYWLMRPVNILASSKKIPSTPLIR